MTEVVTYEFMEGVGITERLDAAAAQMTGFTGDEVLHFALIDGSPIVAALLSRADGLHVDDPPGALSRAQFEEITRWYLANFGELGLRTLRINGPLDGGG